MTACRRLDEEPLSLLFRASPLTVLIEGAFEQGGIEQGLKPVQILLFAGIRPTGPFFKIKTHRSVQQTDGVGIQLELEGGAEFSHTSILHGPTVDAKPQYG
tara:strand:- start:72 stop:374 length:303 start_codon:yes stop_codon:yes gene_type:complete